MILHRSTDNIPTINNAVITIGTFDGVHVAHKKIINRIVTDAKKINGESVIITFYPHPRNIIKPEKPVYNLTTLDEKLNRLRTLQVDHVFVIPFSREFSEMEAQKYAEDFLIKKFNPSIIVFGYDHHFGKNRSGDINLLKKIASKYNITVEEISEQMVSDITISSTKIRNYLTQHKVQEANKLLGYAYQLTGLVVKGDKIGRTLGYPTANIHIDDEYKLLPADGIYAVKCKLKKNENIFKGMMSIGYRPTFNGITRTLEVNIFEFDKTIYGEELTVEFIAFIRKEEKFNSSDELIKAMDRDKIKTMEILKAAGL